MSARRKGCPRGLMYSWAVGGRVRLGVLPSLGDMRLYPHVARTIGVAFPFVIERVSNTAARLQEAPS